LSSVSVYSILRPWPEEREQSYPLAPRTCSVPGLAIELSRATVASPSYHEGSPHDVYEGTKNVHRGQSRGSLRPRRAFPSPGKPGDTAPSAPTTLSPAWLAHAAFLQMSDKEKEACDRWCLEEYPDIAYRFRTTEERFEECIFTLLAK